MKFARSRTAAGIVPVVQAEGRWYDLSPVAADVDPTSLALGLPDRTRTALASGALPPIEPPTGYAPPLSRIGKIVCVGLNYRDHAEETGATSPPEPVLFMKAPDTVVGP